MLEAFKQYSAQHFPFLFSSKVLITVSGGLDSMVLFHLCKTLRFDVSVAHCNFRLRGDESEADTQFVTSYCENQNISLYKKYFDTNAFAKISKTSTQIAARKLRYQWFHELSEAKGFDYILTAHHLNDDLETFLINLGRGSGVEGLTGIPAINGKVVRPLLTFSRKQIKEYAQLHNIVWREDSSNASDKYLRNHLRHHAVPALQNAQPNFVKGFEKTKAHLQQSSDLLRVYTQQLKQEYLILEDDVVSIKLDSLQRHPAPNAVLYAILNDYNFTAWHDIYDLLSAQSGKQVFSSTHKIVKDRDVLLLTSLINLDNQVFTWESKENQVTGPFGKLIQERTKTIKNASQQEIYIDAALVKFPLTIRTRREGDVFYPFGLSGKKKLSKYFKDEKLSLIAKDKTWLLCQGDTIVWVIGMRADNRFKVTNSTQSIIKFSWYDA